LKNTFPEKQIHQATASFLLQAEPEAALYSDQDLYSCQEFESNGFSDSKILFGHIRRVNFLKMSWNLGICKEIYISQG
jgi:hypothetical protein